MEVQFFDVSLEEFIASLDKPTGAKVFRAIDLLERFGSTLGMPHSKKISPQLFELRTKGQREVRILFTFYKNNAVLLHGFVKKTERIPSRELQVAIQKLYTLDRI